tara:strand:+ start:4017 stop:4595 length:579 start_codon:yes stop_codon:yes gene_type:complete
MTFYGDLKKIRREKEIDLGEVANRTKINQDYLVSIEKGDYTFLPHVYVRLFLRAYAVEIGADPDEAVNQLEIHLEKEQISPPEQLSIDDTMRDDHLDDYMEPSKSPLQSRSDIIKVIILVAVFIFAIYIIKQITSSESSEDPNVERLFKFEKIGTKPKEADTDEPQVKDEIPDESSGDNTAEINTLITTPNE